MKWLLFILLILMFIPFVQAEASCFDGVENCPGWRCEEGIDCGGPCSTPCEYAFPWTIVIASAILTIGFLIGGIVYWKKKKNAGLIIGVLLSIPQVIYILYIIFNNRYRCYMDFLLAPSNCYLVLVGYPLLTIISILLLRFIFNTLANHEKYNITLGKILKKGFSNLVLVIIPLLIYGGRNPYFIMGLGMFIFDIQTLWLFILTTLLAIFFSGVVSIRFEHIKNKRFSGDKLGRFLTIFFKFIIILVIILLLVLLFSKVFILLQNAGIIDFSGYGGS